MGAGRGASLASGCTKASGWNSRGLVTVKRAREIAVERRQVRRNILIVPS